MLVRMPKVQIVNWMYVRVEEKLLIVLNVLSFNILDCCGFVSCFDIATVSLLLQRKDLWHKVETYLGKRT